MNITELELFDVTGEGFLVLKTNVDEPTADLRYAWYVKENGFFLYKGQYQRNPYVAVQLPHLGRYNITAYVRNSKGEKITKNTVFRANTKTSPFLKETDENQLSVDPPAVEHISGGFWRFQAFGELPEDARFAWYIYHNGESTPFVRSVYAEEPTYVHKFEESGEYSVKLFVMTENTKCSVMSDSFTVEV